MHIITSRSRIDRKRILLGSSALLVAMAMSGAAQAQCTNTSGGFATELLAAVTPAARGAAINSLVSVLNTSTSVYQAQTGSAFVSSPANPPPGENGGGVWGRALGGSVETKNSSTTNLTGTFRGGAFSGGIACDTETRQDFVGYQVGRDIAKLNWNGWNVHMGATAGYMSSRARDKTSDPVTPATFSSTTEVPFFGSYLAVTRGGFFADAQVRWDFYNMNLNDPANSMFGQGLNARGWSVGGGIGYNLALPNSWFIEPSAGFIYSKVEVDPLGLSGLNAAGIVTAIPGFVQVDDIKSELGRLSLRIGTNVATPYAALQPFITGSVFHEFAGDVTTRVASNANNFIDTAGVITTSRVGTYGQISGGVAGQVLNTGWLGYVRGDYRFGENIEGWALNGGLRYQFTPEPLQAALVGKSLVYKAPPAAVAAPVVWRGLYVGLNAGTIYGKNDYTESAFGTLYGSNLKFGGALLGGQAGYNFEYGKFVLGLEGDIAWSNTKGHGSNPIALVLTSGGFQATATGTALTDETTMDWFATITGRLGYAWDRTLLFVKGGLAAADVTQTISSNVTPVVLASPGSFSKIAMGWTVGVGAEYALSANWSAKAEYLYYDLGSNQYTGYTLLGSPVAVDTDVTGGLARIGLNYRFSPVPAAPVMAKY
ncbi:outer membrane beta-barrel protein [Rhodoplanes azumiensis]|uniref:Outer membrane beta-barrel protein n=1 Tax=Rhodoplanes azumiensis TaxID=1897628 RepID=A0ABW5AQ12_9BRAD